MKRYLSKPNIYTFLLRIHSDDETMPDIIKNSIYICHLMIVIFKNVSKLLLTSGQIKLLFCFIDKIRPQLSNNKLCCETILTELLTDFTESQLNILNTLDILYIDIEIQKDINNNIYDNNYKYYSLVDAKNILENVVKLPINFEKLTRQEMHNALILSSCNSIEIMSSMYIDDEKNKSYDNIIKKLVMFWFNYV